MQIKIKGQSSQLGNLTLSIENTHEDTKNTDIEWWTNDWLAKHQDQSLTIILIDDRIYSPWMYLLCHPVVFH